MSESEFDQLAAKVLSAEASAEEAAQCKAALAGHPAWRQRFEDLRQARALVVQLGWTQKAQAAPCTPIPEERLRHLQETVHRVFHAKSAPMPQYLDFFSELRGWFKNTSDGFRPLRLAAVSFAVVMLVGTLVFLTHQHRQSQLAQTPAPDSLASAEVTKHLALPVVQFLAFYLPPTPERSSATIRLYTPVGSTRHLRPLIFWKGESGKTYDLMITDVYSPGAAPLRVTGLVPPVDFSSVPEWKGKRLKPGTLYRLELRERGNPLAASTSTFLTLDDATDATTASTPAEKLADARQVLASGKSGAAEALADLLTLLPESANADLALRLKVIAFSRLGFREEYDIAANQLKQSVKVQ